MTSGKTVGEIGERELIRRLTPFTVTGAAPAGLFGTGDDCAVLTPPANSQLLITTDLLIENTHFLYNEKSDWEGIGRKAAGANLSDVAAMGATPAGLLVSLALPAHFILDHVLSLYRGMHEYAQQFHAPIIGGDTTRSHQACINITAVGWKEVTAADCLRSSARPGDFLYVTGSLGASRAGVDLLLQPGLHHGLPHDLIQRLIRRHHTPLPRVNVGLALAHLFPRVAVVDISDSLYNEASLLAEASSVETTLNLDAIPVSPDAAAFCAAYNKDSASYSLYSGEEYELLFALPVQIKELRDGLRAAGVDCEVSQVGTVNPGSGVKLLKGGHPVDPQDETFVHFT